MAIERVDIPNEIVRVTAEEERAHFNAECMRFLGISGEEFLRRFDAGEYDVLRDDPHHGDIAYLAMLSYVAR